MASGQGRFLSRLLADGRGQHTLCLPGQDPHPGEKLPEGYEPAQRAREGQARLGTDLQGFFKGQVKDRSGSNL